MKKNSGILLILFVGVLMGALDISIVGPAMPAIEETLHVNEKDLSWLFSIYILFNLVGMSFMAKLSDHFGRRWIYILAVGLFGAGSFMVSVSDNISWLLAGRAIQGFGASGIFPIAAAVIGDTFPVEKRGRALGLIGAVFGFAFILGPLIAGFFLTYFTWNALFIINLPIAFVLMIASVFLLPGRDDDKRGPFDLEGIIMLAIILGAFTVGVNLIDANQFSISISSWPVLPLLLLTLILAPLLLILEFHQKEPVINVKFFRSTQALLVGFIALGLGLFQSSIIFMPQMAVAMFTVEPGYASFMLIPVVIASALGSPLNGRLIDRIGSRIVINIGLLLVAVALFLFGMYVDKFSLFYIAGAMLGLGLSMRAALNYIMLNEVPVRERASTQGILLIFISIGQLSGAALIGGITSSSLGAIPGFKLVFISMAIVACILMVLSLFLKSRKNELKQ